MINNRIYYCWFGEKPLPRKIKKCIHSWKKHCKGYSVIELNERNFDIASAPLYVRQAYEHKKWAFVSDYVRLWALCKYGGVYLDTDVELLKPLDPLLKHRAFVFFETDKSISTGILGCEKGFSLFSEWMESYNDRSFYRENGEPDLTINVLGLSEICSKYGLELNNSVQNIDGFVAYPTEYLFSRLPGRMDITSNTYAIHYFSNSWKSIEEQKAYNVRMSYLKKVLKINRRKQIIKNFLRKQ